MTENPSQSAGDVRSSKKTYPQLILFGDSILEFTNYPSKGGYTFGGGLQEHCARRLDVINRGLSGYNTSHALKVIEHIFPDPVSVKVDYVLLLFGANDACLPSCPSKQHVPLEQYTKNIRTILTHPSLKAHHPKILLVTPPCLNEVHREAEDLAAGYAEVSRTQDNTAKYAAAVREIAAEFEDQNVVLVDLWNALMKEAIRRTPGYVEDGRLLGSKHKGESEGLRSLFTDGLHLTSLGYEVFLKEVVPFVGPEWSMEPFEAPSWVFPNWRVAPKAN